MNFMKFSTIPFGTEFDMGLVCTRLNDLIGVGSWFDSFTVQNTKWLSLFVTLNSERVIWAVFGLYPSYVAGILKNVEINFYVLSNDYLTYADYIEKVTSSEQCIISVSCEKDHFTLSSGEETVLLKFETRIMEGNLPSVLTFTYDILRNFIFSPLAYAIVCIDGRINYITSEMLTSRHDCLYGQRTTYCKWVKRVYYEGFDYLKKYPNA